VDILENTVQPYAWGSRAAIAALRGLPPASGPEAELWMGAHPLAPSRVRRGGALRSLAELVAAAPEAELGRRAVAEHGAQLPFLFKVLAAEQPLSLQAHPDVVQAQQGFAREDAAGVARDAPTRNYRDPHPKPEILCALTPFDALCGFRPVDEALAVLDRLAVPPLAPVRERLAAGGPEGLREAFLWLSTLPVPERGPLVAATATAAAHRTSGAFADAFAWTGRLAALYPADPGVAVALLLRLVHLAPGEALYLPAGNMHAYLRGLGVELMASSDNVLRGGLTPKHVDVPELLRVLRFDEAPIPVLQPSAAADGEAVYLTPARHFELSRVALAGRPFVAEVIGPEILLCTEGHVTAAPAGAEPAVLGPGGSAFVPGTTGRYALGGTGVVFRAALPRLRR
jgi:mannose-6-phosphate isomerase